MHFADWAGYLIRWFHVIAGISWIGSSFYFMWLDAYLEKPETLKPDVEGELWMVHSGGFYEVERKRIGAGRMPKTLHWFKYEALFTWISGAFLLGIVYYMNASAYMIAPGSRITPHEAVLIGVGTIALSWFVYDGIWQLLGQKLPRLATALSVALAGGLAFFFCEIFTGRAAFIHVGAMFGTWMVANVWVRILPAQQKMIDATQQGRTPDYALSGHAKRRSVHNTYMTFPVIFMMISNHYAVAYGGPWNWAILFCLVVFGACTRHVMILKDRPESKKTGKSFAPALTAAVLSAIAAAGMILIAADVGSTGSATAEASRARARVPFQQVQAIIDNRCVKCHSIHPQITTFGPTPGGIQFDSPQRIKSLAERIKLRAVVTKTMPFNNLTGITEQERETLGRWVDQGAHIDERGAQPDE